MKDEALKKAEHALEGVLQVPEKISMMHILDVVRFIRQAREEKQQEPTAASIYEAIKHGDARHQEWLQQALENIFAGQPVPHEAAQPKQEPVAIVAVDGIGQIQVGWMKKPQHNDKLYTSPPARKPLTDADLGMYISKELAEYINGAYADTGCAKDQLIHFARAIEAAHNIKE